MDSSLPSISLEDFQYDLPSERIAQRPLDQRDQSNLLQYREGKITHHRFFQLPDLLPDDCMLLLNDTKVIRARLYFRRATGALIEVLLMHPHDPAEVHMMMESEGPVVWECIIGNKKKWKEGEILERGFEVRGKSINLTASWTDKDRNLIQFEWGGEMEFVTWLEAAGSLPLPPYIQREADQQDHETYQTIYAAQTGAVAAPTAGLHFTEKVMENLHQKGIKTTHATLHVSAGTFLPVKTDSPLEHNMHQEQMVIQAEVVRQLRDHLAAGKPLITVGTTSMRWVESLYWLSERLVIDPSTKGAIHVEKLDPYSLTPTFENGAAALNFLLGWMEEHQQESILGETAIMIMPGYQFQLCDGLITNFHMPETTLMLLVGAFVGKDWRKIYQTALNNEYRFLSYGDSSLLWKILSQTASASTS